MSEKGKEIAKNYKKNSEIAKTEKITDEISEQDNLTSKRLNGHLNLLKRIFPNEADKRIREFQNNLIEQKAASKLESHRMFYEFQRQSIKETLDAVLIQGKTVVRKDIYAFFAVQVSELKTLLLGLSDQHDQDMEAAFSKLEEYKSSAVRKSKEKLLLSITDSFNEDIEKLIERYRGILDELV